MGMKVSEGMDFVESKMKTRQDLNIHINMWAHMGQVISALPDVGENMRQVIYAWADGALINGLCHSPMEFWGAHMGQVISAWDTGRGGGGGGHTWTRSFLHGLLGFSKAGNIKLIFRFKCFH